MEKSLKAKYYWIRQTKVVVLLLFITKITMMPLQQLTLLTALLSQIMI